MNTPETEVAFVNNLRDIASEIVNGVDSSRLRHVEGNAQMLVNHLHELQTEPGEMTRFELADALMTRDQHPSSAKIGDPNLPGNYLNEAVAYTFVHNSDIFASWPDRAKRYLLDRAIQTDIEGFERHDAKANARTIYVSQKDPAQDASEIPMGIFFTPQLRVTQEKLRARISPSSPQMRR